MRGSTGKISDSYSAFTARASSRENSVSPNRAFAMSID